jgi:hypothetical protein
MQCKNLCGTDLLPEIYKKNQGFCSRICSSTFAYDKRRYSNSYAAENKKIDDRFKNQPYPTWDEVRFGQSRV